MNEYVIYCDSACDIVPEVLGEWGVKVACLSYHFSSESRNYLDNEIPAKDFYDKMRAGGVAKTAAVNAETFRRAFEEDFDPETIKKWMKSFYRRFFTQQFKRNCMPDGVKVGNISLCPRGDWRMPSDAAARVWLAEIENL